MTIDVLLPTYNRAHFVTLQIHSLAMIRAELAKVGVDLRIVISDNLSTPAVTVPAMAASFTAVHKPPQHLPTAEENIFFGLQHCTGDYVWLLGDDDAPVVNNAVTIFSQLAIDKSEFVLTNASGSLVGGEILSSRTNCAQPEQIKSLPDFVQRTGFTFVMAGISCTIFKRDVLRARMDAYDKYFKASKIYSLVFWFLEVFWDKSFRYYPEPLVVYKQNKSDMDGDHWVRVAAREGVFRTFPWTLGWVRLSQLLIDARRIQPGFFASAIEQNWTHRIPAVGLCLSIYLDQVAEDAQGKKSPCRAATEDERTEFLNFMMREDPRYLEVYAILMRGDLTDRAVLFEARCVLASYTRYFFSAAFVKAVSGWNIYRFDGVYRALPAQFLMDLHDELSDIAPRSSAYQLVGQTLAEVEEQISAVPYPKKHPVVRSSVLMTKKESEVLLKWARLLNRLKKKLPDFLKERLS